MPCRYDDGGFTGGNMDRPALRQLVADIEAQKIDCVVVYKVDRLSRSLLDFARIMEVFDRHKVAFVSVTQQFNTATSMGRLVLNVPLSFAQLEREIIGERIREKIAGQQRNGKWTGGTPVLGYDVDRAARRHVYRVCRHDDHRFFVRWQRYGREQSLFRFDLRVEDGAGQGVCWRGVEGDGFAGLSAAISYRARPLKPGRREPIIEPREMALAIGGSYVLAARVLRGSIYLPGAPVLSDPSTDLPLGQW
ncbi:MAG: recombinase family protein [Pirellulales bacterium]